MRDTFRLWIKIFSAPVEGYRAITPQTKLAPCLLVLFLAAAVSGLLLVPVVTSQAYQDAYHRADLNLMQRLGPPPAAADKPAEKAMDKAEEAAADKSATAAPARFSPVLYSIGVVLTPPLNLLLALFCASFILWGIGVAVKNKIPFRVIMRLFAFTWAVFAWTGLLQSLVVLVTGQAAVLAKVNTFGELRLALTVPFSLSGVLSLLFPAGTIPVPVLYVVDFATNLFHIIFYYLLWKGLRVLSGDQPAGKSAAAVIVLVLFHFMAGAAPSLLF